MGSVTDSPPAPTRRWWILAVIGVAQLMVILDNSVVNIALPSAQADLGFTDAQRQWVVTAYALAFGSLLLLGGRLSDLFGRRTAFVVGLIGFAVASALGGLAPGFGLLVAARALQGVFGALLAPAALSLLTTTFPERPRPCPRLRRVRDAGGLRRRDRAAARRGAHGVRRLALVHVRQRRLRGRRAGRRA